MVPTGTGKWEGIFQSENFGKTGKDWKSKELNKFKIFGEVTMFTNYLSTNIFLPCDAPHTCPVLSATVIWKRLLP